MNTYTDFKNKISILQVAESLGYKYTLKSSKLRPVLSNGSDTIVVSNVTETKNQKYFVPLSNEKGDVIDFIKNRLNQFNVESNNEIDKINKIINTYTPIDYKKYRETKGFYAPPEFNIKIHNPTPAKLSDLKFLKDRGLTDKTLNDFLKFIYVIDNNNYKNIGFPYLKNDTICNFELRNYNFKGHCIGGNKTDAYWEAAFTDKKLVQNVFMFESAIDAMSFYQLYSPVRLFDNAAFLSFGGSVSTHQINEALMTYPQAKIITCFDNDRAGHIFDIKVGAAKNNIVVGIILDKATDSLIISAAGLDIGNNSIKNKEIKLTGDEISFKNFIILYSRKHYKELQNIIVFKADNKKMNWKESNNGIKIKDFNDIVMEQNKNMKIKRQ